MKTDSFFAALPDAAREEVFDTIVDADNVTIERIVSSGQASPSGYWYDQERHEWVMVLRGRAGLQFEDGGEVLEMGPGDCVDIPAHQKHRVAWTADDEPTVWLAVHYRRGA